MSHTTKITRYRGDTARDRFQMVDENGAALNITNWTFRMAVDTRREPPDATTQLVLLTGQIDDAPNGLYSFPWTPAEADQTPGQYWFDIEATDQNGEIKTVELGAYVFRQDLSK